MSDGTMYLLLIGLPIAIFFVLLPFLFWFPAVGNKLAEGALRAPAALPHFPYAASEPAAAAECAICLDQLRQGQLCSEVPACRHVFHEGCIRAWARKKNSCPMCRAMIVVGAGGTRADDNMV